MARLPVRQLVVNDSRSSRSKKQKENRKGIAFWYRPLCTEGNSIVLNTIFKYFFEPRSSRLFSLQMVRAIPTEELSRTTVPLLLPTLLCVCSNTAIHAAGDTTNPPGLVLVESRPYWPSIRRHLRYCCLGTP